MKKIAETIGEFHAAELPESIHDYIDEIVMSLEAECNVLPEDTFMDILGGDFYIVESPEDLKEIKTFHFGRTGEFLTLAEASGAFDEMTKIGEDEYVTLLVITNNSGGNTYFIPIDIYNGSRFLIESYSLTNGL